MLSDREYDRRYHVAGLIVFLVVAVVTLTNNGMVHFKGEKVEPDHSQSNYRLALTENYFGLYSLDTQKNSGD